jgi:hypothetical protein
VTCSGVLAQPPVRAIRISRVKRFKFSTLQRGCGQVR